MFWLKTSGFPSIEWKQNPDSESGYTFINLCGNLAKHSFARTAAGISEIDRRDIGAEWRRRWMTNQRFFLLVIT